MIRPFIYLTLLLSFSLSLSANRPPRLGVAPLEEIIEAMTLEEKIRLLTGTGEVTKDLRAAIGHTEKIVPGAAGTTYPIPRLGIPAIVMADGPAGLRISSQRKGSERTYYCTAFPVATLLASTWNSDLVEEVGEAIGNEVLEYGCDILLAPALNIHRNPLCGRNYEYYSEDPFLTGRMAVSMVKGIQSNGVGTSVKHFAVNNQETNRIANNAILSERALREIYLKGFEMVVKEAKPWTLMSSYNKVNGAYTSESTKLLSQILRGEWGFDGTVVTDWFGGRNAVRQVKAGNDILMPGKISQQQEIIKGLQDGKIAMSDIDKNVRRILELILKTPRFKSYRFSEQPDLAAHASLTRTAATEGMILLKNGKNTLPLAANVKLGVFGNTSYRFLSGGTGSGDVNEAYSISLEEGMLHAGFEMDKELEKKYKSYILSEENKIDKKKYMHVTPPRIKECPLDEHFIRQKAEECETALLTIGRNAGEYSDRILEDDFNICPDEKALIEKVCRAFHKAGKKVVVILNINGVIETASWKDLPDAILLAWQGGQEGGHSVADILSGKVSPSGKLPMTFPISYEDESSFRNFPLVNAQDAWKIYREFFTGPQGYERPNIDYTYYKEDIYVGYRHFDRNRLKVSYPFGFGLSYTDFRYSDAECSFDGEKVDISCKITNTGKTAGKETVQVYVSAPEKILDKPEKELKSFAKTRLLQPGESQTLYFSIPVYFLSSFNEELDCWHAEPGRYRISIARSSREYRLKTGFNLEKEIRIKK